MHKKSVFFSRFLVFDNFYIARPLFSFITSELSLTLIKNLEEYNDCVRLLVPTIQNYLCSNVFTYQYMLYKIFSLFYGVFKSSIGTFQLVFGFNFIRSNDKVWQGKLIDFWMRHPVPLASFTHDVQRAVTKIDQHRIIPVMLRYKRVFLSTKMPKWGQNRYEAAFDFH